MSVLVLVSRYGFMCFIVCVSAIVSAIVSVARPSASVSFHRVSVTLYLHISVEAINNPE